MALNIDLDDNTADALLADAINEEPEFTEALLDYAADMDCALSPEMEARYRQRLIDRIDYLLVRARASVAEALADGPEVECEAGAE